MNGTILGMRKREIDRKFDEIVAFSGVEKFLDTPIKRYSSGMKVRLAFSVAAHLEPEILIIDEVLAVGDAAFQRKCIGKMENELRSGRTVLFVSHNMAAIESLCQRAILVENGSLAAIGRTQETVSEYLECVNNEDSSDGIAPSEFSRKPNTTGLVRSVALFDSQQKRTQVIRLGEACDFRVVLESQEFIPSVLVGIHVQTEGRQRVTSFHTRYQSCPLLNLHGQLVLNCKCAAPRWYPATT